MLTPCSRKHYLIHFRSSTAFVPFVLICVSLPSQIIMFSPTHFAQPSGKYPRLAHLTDIPKVTTKLSLSDIWNKLVTGRSRRASAPTNNPNNPALGSSDAHTSMESTPAPDCCPLPNGHSMLPTLRLMPTPLFHFPLPAINQGIMQTWHIRTSCTHPIMRVLVQLPCPFSMTPQ